MGKGKNKKRGPIYGHAAEATREGQYDIEKASFKLARIALTRHRAAFNAAALTTPESIVAGPVGNAMTSAIIAAGGLPEELDELASTYLSGVLAAGTRIHVTHQNFLDALRKQTVAGRVRARLMAYFFSIVIQNCAGTDFEPAEKLLLSLGPFNLDKELLEHGERWEPFPLSGALYNDIRVNCVARRGLAVSGTAAERFIGDCLRAIEQQFIASAILQFGLRASLPILPPPSLSDDEMSAYLDAFAEPTYSQTKTKRREAEVAMRRSFATHIVESIASGNMEAVLPIFTDARHLGLGERPGLDFSIAGGAINRAMRATGKSAPDINFASIISNAATLRREGAEIDVTRLGSDPGIAKTISSTDSSKELAQLARAAIERAAILDRERLAMEEARAAATARSKITLLEGRISQLQAEVDAMSARSDSTTNPDIAGHIRNKVDAQSERIRKLEARLEELAARELTAMEQIKSLRAENTQLETTVRELSILQAVGNSSDADRVSGLDTSVFDNMSVVVVGGHQSWAIAMRAIHKNVKIYDAEGPMPTDDVLKNADIIWLQPNAISHPVMWRVIDAAKASDTPFRYFSYAGHRQCKKQIVSETRSVFSAEAIRQRRGL